MDSLKMDFNVDKFLKSSSYRSCDLQDKNFMANIGNILAHNFQSDIHEISYNMKDDNDIKPIKNYLLEDRGSKLLFHMANIASSSNGSFYNKELAYLLIDLLHITLKIVKDDYCEPNQQQQDTQPQLQIAASSQKNSNDDTNPNSTTTRLKIDKEDDVRDCFRLLTEISLKGLTSFSPAKLKSLVKIRGSKSSIKISSKKVSDDSTSDSDDCRTSRFSTGGSVGANFSHEHPACHHQHEHGLHNLHPRQHYCSNVRLTGKSEDFGSPSDFGEANQDTSEGETSSFTGNLEMESKGIPEEGSLDTAKLANLMMTIISEFLLYEQLSFSRKDNLNAISYPNISFTVIETLPTSLNLINEDVFQHYQNGKVFNRFIKMMLIACCTLVQHKSGISAIEASHIVNKLIAVSLVYTRCYSPFGDEILIGLIYLLTCVAQSLPWTSEYQMMNQFMRIFLLLGGNKLLINCLTNDYDNFFTKVLSSLTLLLTSLQRSKVLYSHQSNCGHRKHTRCNLYPLLYHHNNILGQKSHCHSLHKLPVCCISSIANILFEILPLVQSSFDALQLVDSLSQYSLCCCLNAHSAFEQLITLAYRWQSSEICKPVLDLIEDVSARRNPELDCCKPKSAKDEVSSIIHDTADSNYYSDGSSVADENTHDCKIGAIYRNLLNSPDSTIRTLVSRHILSILKSEYEPLWYCLCQHVVFPMFLGKSSSKVDTELSLTLLAVILSNNRICKQFLSFGGLNQLCSHLKETPFSKLSLITLEILINSEAKLIGYKGLVISREETLPGLVAYMDILCERSKELNDELRVLFSSSAKVNDVNDNDSLTLDKLKNNILPNLHYVTNLWTVHSKLSRTLPAYISYMKSNFPKIVNLSHETFITALITMTDSQIQFNLSPYSTTEPEKKSLFLRLNYLLELVIPIVIRSTPIVSDDGVKNRVDEGDVYSILKEKIMKFRANGGDDDLTIQILKMLLNSSLSFVQKSQDSVSLSIDPANSKQQSSLSTLVSSSNKANEILSVNDLNESELESDQVITESCYEADDEACYVESFRKMEKVQPVQPYKKHSYIQYPQLCRLVVDLVISFNNETLDGNSKRVIETIFNTLLKYCRENPVNCEVMQQNELTGLILEGFRPLLVKDSNEFRPAQQVVFDLFLELSSNSIQSQDLKLLLVLFKDKSSPLDLLISVLMKLVLNQRFNPTFSLSFPSQSALQSLEDISSPSSSSSSSTSSSSTFSSSASSSVHWVNELRSEARLQNFSTGWSNAALALPLPLNKNISLFKNRKFSLTLWFSVERTRTQSAVIVATARRQVQKVKTYDDRFHLITVSLDKTSIEIWLDHDQRMFIFRTLKIVPGKPMVIAQVSNPCHLSFSGNWHHVCFNFEELKAHQVSGAALLINYIVDATKTETVALHHGCPTLNTRTSLLLGSIKPSTSNLTVKTGNLIIFKRELSLEHCLYLFAMGPDFCTFRTCQIPELEAKLETLRLPKYFSLNKTILDTYLALSPSNCFNDLQESIFVIFKPFFTDHFLLYTPMPSESSFISFTPRSSLGEVNNLLQVTRNPLVLFSELKCTEDANLAKALVDNGGIGVLIFFFAKIVEITSDQEIQAQAFEILLKMCQTYYELMLSFAVEFKGFRLINSILETPNCNVSRELYRPYLSICLNSCNTKEAIITDSTGFSHLIASWRAWHQKPETIDCFTTMLTNLVSSSNPHQNFNIIQMRRGNIADILLTMLKDTLVQMDDNNFTLPLEVAQSLPLIIKALITTSSLDLSILNDVFDTILLLHQASNTYVCHTKNSFYYLLSFNWKSAQSSKRSSTEPQQGTSLALPVVSERTKHLSGSDLNDKIDNNCDIDNGATVADDDDETMIDQKIVYNLVMSGFITMIGDVVSEAPNSMLDKIIGPIIRPGFLVVLAHNENDNVREAVLKSLLTCLKRGKGLEACSSFVNKSGLHLIGNQLHQHQATFNLINQAFAFIMKADYTEKYSFEENFPSPDIYKITSDHWSSFIILFSLLPNSVRDVNLCHTTLTTFLKFLEDLPLSTPLIKHLYEIGLVECMIKVLINAEKFKSGQEEGFDSIDGYEDDVIISDVFKIISTIGRNLFLSTGSQFWALFIQTLGILTSLEKKSNMICKNWLREAIVQLFEAAHDAVGAHLTELMKARDDRSKFMKALNKSEKFFNLFSPSDESYLTAQSTGLMVETASMLSYSSVKSQPSLSGDTESVKENKGHVSNSELNDRFKKLIFRSVDFLLMRDNDLPLSEKEKFFSRSLCHRLFQILDLNKKGLSNKRKRSILNSFIGTSKEAIRAELVRLILFLLAPLQSTKERLYYVGFLKSNTENLATLLRANNRFSTLLESFLKDLSISCEDSESRELVRDLLRINPIGNNPNKRMLTNEFSKREIGEWFSEWNKEKGMISSNQQDDVHLDRLRPLSHKVTENAMAITRDAVEAQNQERKVFINHLKHLSSERYSIHKNWKSLIEMFTHERSVWYYPDSYFHSWELDPTEGPMRIRRRLRRCHLDIPDKFFCKESRKSTKYLSKNLAYLFSKRLHESDFTDLIDRLYTNERILYTTSCIIIAPAEEYPGEILIGSSCIHFVGEQKTPYSESSVFTEVWLFDEIKEIHQCRYQLQNNAFEMFLTNGSSYLISFENKANCDEFLKILYMRTLSNLTEEKNLAAVTQMWREGTMTNFEYLTYLNKMSGRSFNDLMQYPVFPFILADYESDVLNLKAPTSFRNLSRPMAVQQKSKEKYYVDQYNYLKEEYERSAHVTDTLFPTTGPYHYGSHYSNSGTVLHFLVRLPPFTQMFLAYQDNNFDIPDRTFHSMATSWRLASGDSTTDFKELIPEFFFLPEFLKNLEKFNFGVRQNGEVVDDVKLPTWCRGDARLFVFIHRQALESDYVSQNLQDWIDLVFGYKQTGRSAIEAINCFHPATYYGVDCSKVEDPVKKKALQTMIKTFGQMPKQLFNSPHPGITNDRRLKESRLIGSSPVNVMKEVIGIKWGTYVGSPSEVDPLIIHREKSSRKIAAFYPLITNDVFSLEANSCLLLTYNRPKSSSGNPVGATYITSSALVSWDHPDNIIRIKFSRNGSAIPLISGNSTFDKVTLCATTPGRNILMLGYQSGLISVYNFAGPVKGKSELSGCKSWLHGHQGPIRCIVINQEFNVIVSGSSDGSVVLWDLNRICYVRTLTEHSNEILSITISPTLGDIATLSEAKGQSLIRINTINGALVGEIQSKESTITAMCYSSSPEGVSVNVLAVGYSDGVIRMFNSWDLSLIRLLTAPKFNQPIKCMTFTHDNQHFHVASEDGTIIVWGKSNTKKNNLVHVFFHSDSSN